MKELHLICNAHLDPIWQWEWEEGAAAAISTFRSAADLADEFDYVFCHNEVTLYKYISEYAPTLFERIKELVRKGKWHIMGGWYLQPDCNMPGGESLVRQIRVGQKYFYDNFGVKPTTAINFDSFGHSKGLVQIMKKCGQDSYILCRAGNDPLPARNFMWKGFDNTEVKVFWAREHYNSPLGKSAEAIKNKAQNQEDDVICVLWGVGNHGGGPSRKDLADIEKMTRESTEYKIIHSTPEKYFSRVNPTTIHEKSMRTVMPGCYTSSSKTKLKHAELENNLWMTEKMCTSAALKGVMVYPEKEINEVVEDLLESEFHDVICGSTIKAGEENGLRFIEHGLHILNKIRAKAFFALAGAEPSAKEGEYPILVYNPHPYKFKTAVKCEFMLADQNWKNDIHSSFRLFDSNGTEIPVQVVKEESNINLDWRKKIVFNAELEPLGVTRFSLYTEFKPCKESFWFDDRAVTVNSDVVFDKDGRHIEFDGNTGLLKSFVVDGVEYIDGSAFKPIMYKDNEDPWGMGEKYLSGIGTEPTDFELMMEPDGPFAGLKPISIIEDGEAYFAIECFMKCKNTRLRMEYDVYKAMPYIDVKVDIFPNDVNCMIKLAVPCSQRGTYIGQTAYGAEELYMDGRECVAQRFVALKNDSGKCLALMNKGTYGSSYKDGIIYQSLIRGASYCTHPIDNLPLVPKDRYVKKMELSEQSFEFRLCVCDANSLEKLAAEFNQPIYALNVFPVPGEHTAADLPIGISDDSVVLVTAKKEDGANRWIFRLFNGAHENRVCIFNVGEKQIKLDFAPFSVKTVTLAEDILAEEPELII